MKKFLSLVLALVLTMSLVVVPANAAVTGEGEGEGGGTPPGGGTQQTVSVESVTLNPSTAALFVGETVTLNATVTPQNATNKTVTWSSDPEAVATVDNSGKVTAVAAGTATITAKADEQFATCEVTVKDKYVLTAKADKTTLYYNGTKAFKTATVTATLKKIGDTQTVNEDYTIELREDSNLLETNGTTISVASTASSAQSNIPVTVTAKVGNEVVATKSVTINVADRYTLDFTPAANTVKVGERLNLSAVLKDNESGQPVPDADTPTYKSTDQTVASVSANGVVTGSKMGRTSIEASLTHNREKYTVSRDVTVNAAPAKLSAIKNGDYRTYTPAEIAAAIRAATGAASTNVSLTVPDRTWATIYPSVGSAAATSGTQLDITAGMTVYANRGCIGTMSCNLSATVDGAAYNVTLEIPITSAGSVSDTVYAYVTSSNSVSFELPSGYDTLYYKQGSVSSYDGLWTSATYAYQNGWRTCSSSVKGTLPLSSFSNTGKTTISAVGIAGGVAYTGTLTVVLNSYNIEYSGVAGETVTFDQGDFEDFMEEAAEDYGWINTSSSSTAYVKFNRVVFSIPAEKTQGILYNDGEQIKFNSNSSVKECTDLDEVTFAIADKTGLKEVVINFTLYADYYSSERVTNPVTRTFSGRVVVNVVHEDIKYTVPVDGSVVFKAEDFQDFFDDTYKTGTLSYVKFTELPKVTDGALYATYSAIYAGTVAEESDKFYYDSKKVSDYDLDDVTFRTSLWSKAGTKVYIPFTAYGTKSYQSVDGWVVITVENARTMNFTDVKTGDWFYNNVKNAYAMGLIEGKTTTTFNPNDNMTYAEAVTLAARMNQLYYSGKVTLSNSTTGNWYSSYESYAISKGIISSALGNKANTKITRKDYVDIFYNALPASAYTARNTVSKIPDLANNTANAKVYAFYRAGILTGYANTPGKTNGAFGPNDNIKRSEVATILIRMMDSGTRVYFTM